MTVDVDKVIITNGSALKAKYHGRVSQIDSAVKRLIAADKKRGLNTRRVDVDDATAMKALGGTAVRDARSEKQAKAAIDAIFAAWTPDYLMILGSHDVIPQQHLVNPAYDPAPEGDPDETVPADLPYACNAAFSTDIADFTGPTRIVGRLPDLTGSDDPHYLVDLLETAASYQSFAPDDYFDFLGISADAWQASTESSLKIAFGTADGMQVSPPDGPNGHWPKGKLGRRAHFFNCHGASLDFRFYGQPDNKDDYPVALTAKWLPGRISEGTVVAAECCYGAQLYAPSDVNGQMGICNTYLQEKAYGFFGSSTIAYGPDGETGPLVNDNADLICRYFWQHVLEGASTGRAALQARQDLVMNRSPLDPYNMKTLGQYNLLGDPSITVAVPKAAARVTRELKQRKAKSKSLVVPSMSASSDPGGYNRALRRYRLGELGLALGAAAQVARAADTDVPSPVKRVFRDWEKELNVRMKVRTFSIEGATRALTAAPRGGGRGKRLRAARPDALSAPRRFHVASAALPHKEAPMRQLVVLIATEIEGGFLVRRVRSR
jgi:Peptidase family C25